MYGAGNVFSACSIPSVRHACLFPNRTAWHVHMGYQAQYYLTLAYSSSSVKDESNFSCIILPNMKSTEVGLFISVKQQRLTLKCHSSVTAGDSVEILMCHALSIILIISRCLVTVPKWPLLYDQNAFNVWHSLLEVSRNGGILLTLPSTTSTVTWQPARSLAVLKYGAQMSFRSVQNQRWNYLQSFLLHSKSLKCEFKSI